MSAQARGISLSIVFHAIFFSLFFFFASYKPVHKKVIALDFSMINSPKPVAAPAPKAAVKPVKKKLKKVPEPLVKKEKTPVPDIKKKPLIPEPTPIEQTRVIEPVAEEIKPVEEVIEEPDIIEDMVEENRVEDRTLVQTSIDSPAPTSATGSVADAKAQYLKNHFLYIKEAIQKNIVYPRLARKRGWQGTTKVSFTICEDGSVTDIKIEEGSGYALLDKNAIATVKKAAPFPKPPVRAKLFLPISYKLS